MCGRFTLIQDAAILQQHLKAQNVPYLQPRYNIAPGQPVLTLRKTVEGKQWFWMRWGLIPAWAKDPTISNKLINAKAETLREKPSFREAFTKRRCLIPASGFYEWQKQGKYKQPYYLTVTEREPIAMAGLWECWKSPTGQVIESCTILTTQANEKVNLLHNRMPVILERNSYDLWLDGPTEDLDKILTPYPAHKMKVYPVSKSVNDATYDAQECLEEVAAIGVQTSLDLRL